MLTKNEKYEKNILSDVNGRQQYGDVCPDNTNYTDHANKPDDIANNNANKSHGISNDYQPSNDDELDQRSHEYNDEFSG
ncbi:hypothetical protein [Flavisolibacter ginsenosidimutans]|uniref:hypothetical protein n=1 Tax=Flavisolibacter ginsenosidimutans TaxID=661481 RepID=UPI00155A9D2B|nr:hypothetical protein [Flavisolibacter ginsenosidimutans]